MLINFYQDLPHKLLLLQELPLQLHGPQVEEQEALLPGFQEVALQKQVKLLL